VVQNLTDDLEACLLDNAACHNQIILLEGQIVYLEELIEVLTEANATCTALVASLTGQIIDLLEDLDHCQNQSAWYLENWVLYQELYENCTNALDQCNLTSIVYYNNWHECQNQLGVTNDTLNQCQNGWTGTNDTLSQCREDLVTSINETETCQTALAISQNETDACQKNLTEYVIALSQIPGCFGISGWYHSVCNFHGDCVSADVCSCEGGWTGVQCDIPPPEPVCYGISQSDPSVCSGHGNCVDVDDCDCDNGWTGDQCDQQVISCPMQCYGVNFNSPLVCGGYGACTAQDTCVCASGYSGDNCETWTCDGIPNGDVNICSGHGYCVLPDTCACVDGYVGDQCQNEPQSTCNEICEWPMTNYPACDEIDKCRGTYANIAGVCGFRGKWGGVSYGVCRNGQCKCQCGFSGSKCHVVNHWVIRRYCRKNQQPPASYRPNEHCNNWWGC